jgi:hypothetical protein
LCFCSSLCGLCNNFILFFILVFVLFLETQSQLLETLQERKSSKRHSKNEKFDF